jgi:hypothetical protein
MTPLDLILTVLAVGLGIGVMAGAAWQKHIDTKALVLVFEAGRAQAFNEAAQIVRESMDKKKPEDMSVFIREIA